MEVNKKVIEKCYGIPGLKTITTTKDTDFIMNFQNWVRKY